MNLGTGKSEANDMRMPKMHGSKSATSVTPYTCTKKGYNHTHSEKEGRIHVHGTPAVFLDTPMAIERQGPTAHLD